jgi:hypothetical protein
MSDPISWQKAQDAAAMLTRMRRGEASDIGMQWELKPDGLYMRLTFVDSRLRIKESLEMLCADLCVAMLNNLPRESWPT